MSFIIIFGTLSFPVWCERTSSCRSATSSGDASTRHKSSSSSSSSAADVDVHAAWDNYDLAPPLPAATRRRSDDRCSLLTHSTDSTASLKSCRSHNAAVSRSLLDVVCPFLKPDPKFSTQPNPLKLLPDWTQPNPSPRLGN